MKTYKQIIELLEERRGSEIDFSKSVCEILGKRSPPLLDGNPIDHFLYGSWYKMKNKADEAGNSGISELASVMLDWTQGFKTKRSYTPDDLLNKMKKIFTSCPKLGGWLRFNGKIYRGLTIPNTSLQSIFKPQTFISLPPEVDKAVYFLAGNINYKSNSPAQSWTNDINLAYKFAIGDYRGAPDYDVWKSNNKGKTSVVLEYRISPNESLNLSKFGNTTESEIIRLKNDTIGCKCYIPVLEGPLDFLFLRSSFGWRMLSQEQKLKIFKGNSKLLSSFESLNEYDLTNMT